HHSFGGSPEATGRPAATANPASLQRSLLLLLAVEGEADHVAVGRRPPGPPRGGSDTSNPAGRRQRIDQKTEKRVLPSYCRRNPLPSNLPCPSPDAEGGPSTTVGLNGWCQQAQVAGLQGGAIPDFGLTGASDQQAVLAVAAVSLPDHAEARLAQRPA